MNHVKPDVTIIIGATQLDRSLYRSDTAQEVRAKIDEAKRYPFPPEIRIEGKPVTWETYHRVLASVVGYREMQGTLADGSVRVPMADRPPVLVVAIKDGHVCQLDCYTGHDFLENDRFSGDHNTEYQVPNFADLPSYGLRLPGLGMVAWYMGSFQTNIMEQEVGR